MKYIAVQTGARRGYAVPQILHAAGLLDRFYTDFAGNIGWCRLAKFLPLKSSHLSRLIHRRIPEQIVGHTMSFESTQALHALGSIIGSNDTEHAFRRMLLNDSRLGNAMISAGFGEATHVYSMLSEAGSFMAEAYKRGLTVVSEVYILLSTERILDAERIVFAEWEPGVANYSELRQAFVTDDVLMSHTHYYMCPSEAVRDDLVENWGVSTSATRIVPYGMSPSWLELEPRPQQKRVLFVGTADLRKGIHYLAMAAEKLASRGRRYEFRVAGNATDVVRQRPVCKYLNFLGRVPRSRIHEEFQQADVFVLPSLAEGSAEVSYEALAAGVPSIVTKATGAVVRDGIEGMVIPERDPDALADCIELVVEDRSIRSRMATAARERAREYTWDKYGERLIAALQTLTHP